MRRKTERHVCFRDFRSAASEIAPRIRDHFGIKPLYYYRDQGRFLFGSEIKAILASGAYSPDINRQGLYDYFTFLYVPCPETIFKGIFQVPPANVLELDLRTNDLKVRRYWRLADGLDRRPRGEDGTTSQ